MDDCITDVPESTKFCPKCKETKLRSEFSQKTSTKDGLQGWCKKCCAEKNALWRQNNSTYYVQYAQNNREQKAASTKQWVEINSKKYAAYQKQWHKDNFENQAALKAEYYAKNSAELRQRISQYRRTPEGKAVDARSRHKRRAQFEATPATLTTAEWQSILERQNFRCSRCEREFSKALPPTRDHILPVSKGGALTLENCQALCQSCNSKKATKTADYRMPEREG